MKKIILVFIFPLLMTGCYSNLKVTVKTADRDIILKNSDELIRGDILNTLALLSGFITDASQDRDTILENITNYYEKDLKGKMSVEAKKRIMGAYDLEVNKINTLISQASDEYQKKIISSPSDTLQYRNELIDKFTVTYSYINQAQIKIVTLISYLNTHGSSERNIIKGTTLEKTNNDLTNARMRFPILGDPLTSFITKDKNEHIWKSVFNKTVSRTFIGNSDIAMILRSNPPEQELKSGDYNNNFTIKGVRMDASDATTAFFTGLTQTMNFIASTQGIPLKSKTATAENPLPEENTLASNMYSDVTIYELKKKKITKIKKLLLLQIQSYKIENLPNSQVDSTYAEIRKYWKNIKNTKDLK